MSNSTLNTPLKKDRLWMVVFLFCFTATVIDGMDIMLLSFSLTSLETEFGLTQPQKGSFATYSMLGMCIGGILSGWMADRFGRVKTIVWSIVLFAITTCMLGATQSYLQFAVIRFISAIGLGAVYILCNTLMGEYVPTRHRTTLLGTLQAGLSIGYIAASLLANLLIPNPNYGWRWMFFLTAIPAIFVFLVSFLIPEPPSWVQENERRKREAVMPKAPSLNRIMQTGSLRILLRDPVTQRMFLFWTLTSIMLTFGYYGVNNWFPNFIEKEIGVNFKSMTLFMVGSYAAMVVSKILAGMAADYLGRRFIFAFGTIATALFIPVIIYFRTPENIPYLMIIFGFLYGIPYGVNGTYMIESFETRVRATAAGAAYNIGRGIAAVAPVAIGFIAIHYSIAAGLLLMGAAYFISGLIPALFIKEKRFNPQQ